MGIGARIEHRYCEPVAEALAADGEFSRFFFQKANRPDWAGARRLKDEQIKMGKRRFWWKDWCCHERRCVCPNLSGRQIDILAVSERTDGRRLGMHIECKHPGDKFRPGQAARYRERLACWTQPGKGPRTIPRHEEAIAILLCDRGHRHAATDIEKFHPVIYFDEIAARLPIYPAPEAAAHKQGKGSD